MKSTFQNSMRRSPEMIISAVIAGRFWSPGHYCKRTILRISNLTIIDR